MKKSLLMLLCLLCLAAAVLAEEAVPTATPAPTMPVFEWECNPAGHWRMLESGEKADLGIHKLADDMICTVCGAEVWVYDDLSGDVYYYDDFGTLIRHTSYANDGMITYDFIRALTYDDNGHVLHALEFIDGVLFGEITYAVNADGESIPVTEYAWYDDGTWALNEFDEYGNCIRATTYDEEDNLTSETISEYKLLEDGWFYESKNTTRMDDAVFVTEYNEYCDTVRRQISEAGVVWTDCTYEYEYRNGQKLWCKTYEQGRLSRETVYDPEAGMPVKETEYYDDNTVIVSEFNLIGDPLSISFLAADGTLEMTQTFEYVYDEYDSILSCKAYVNGVLVLFTEYAADEFGWTYVGRETMYNEDGSYTVVLFDANEEIVSETNYNAQGAVIE